MRAHKPFVHVHALGSLNDNFQVFPKMRAPPTSKALATPALIACPQARDMATHLLLATIASLGLWVALAATLSTIWN